MALNLITVKFEYDIEFDIRFPIQPEGFWESGSNKKNFKLESDILETSVKVTKQS